MEKTTLKMNSQVYLQCKHKGCDKIVFTPMGAITHAKRAHTLSVPLKRLEKYYTIVENPPQEIVDEVQRKKKYQKQYTTNKRSAARQQPPPSDGPRFKCNGCGLVVAKKNSLYSHCERVHKKRYSQIGSTVTDEPLSHPERQRQLRKAQPDPMPLSELMKSMPQVLDIPNAEATEDGLILTVRFKISPAFVASVILPSVVSQ
jgi:hypothetical protein